jgi:hypothetical protein
MIAVCAVCGSTNQTYGKGFLIDRDDSEQGSSKDKRHEFSYHSGFPNGLAISSKPSTGLRTVMVGPRKTTKPNLRV